MDLSPRHLDRSSKFGLSYNVCTHSFAGYKSNISLYSDPLISSVSGYGKYFLILVFKSHLQLYQGKRIEKICEFVFCINV